MEFSEKDAADLAKLKEIMLSKAVDGDAHAATAFANLLNAETERSKAVVTPTQEKPAALAEMPATWRESVAGRAAEPEARAVA
jgi:hypothetical protein